MDLGSTAGKIYIERIENILIFGLERRANTGVLKNLVLRNFKNLSSVRNRNISVHLAFI